MILTIAGPSGSGKTTVLDGIREHIHGARPLESVTTRPERATDQPGEYEKVTDAEFDRLINQGEFLWHVAVHSYRYGTRKKAVEDALEAGYVVAILVLEAVEQLYAYAAKIGKSDMVRSVYLRLDDTDEQRRRLKDRRDTKDIEERIVECKTWNEKAARATFPLQIIDATKTKEEVLRQTLAYFTLL